MMGSVFVGEMGKLKHLGGGWVQTEREMLSWDSRRDPELSFESCLSRERAGS